MSKTLKFGLALVLIGLGLVTAISVVDGGDFFRVEDEKFVLYEDVYEANQFAEIEFDLDNRKIYVLTSEDEDIHVKYYVHERETYIITEENELFYLEIDMKWYYNLVSFYNFITPSYYEVYLYLPETLSVYDLDLDTSNGSVTVNSVSELGDVSLETSNGDVMIKNALVNNLVLSTSNGKIEITNVESLNDIIGRSSSGLIFLDEVSGKDLDFSTSNGEITTSNILFENLKLISSNGVIDASVFGEKSEFEIRISTSNGKRYIDGERVYDSVYNSNQANKVIIHSSNGDVSLNFDN